MIRSFGNRAAADLYHGVSGRSSRGLPVELHAKAVRLLDQLDACERVEMLRIPPGNRLERLSGEWAGFYSIRINQQWRVVFRWTPPDAYDVRILDYHR